MTPIRNEDMEHRAWPGRYINTIKNAYMPPTLTNTCPLQFAKVTFLFAKHHLLPRER